MPVPARTTRWRPVAMAAATASAISTWPARASPPPGRAATTLGQSASTPCVRRRHPRSPLAATLPVAGRCAARRRPVPSAGAGDRRTANVQWCRREPARGARSQADPRPRGVVMDGNGRWAQKRGLKRTDGHAAGEEALFDVVDGALELGIKWLTVYAFSTENWRRPVDEVRYLMNFNRDDPHAPARRAERPGRAGPLLRPARLAGAQAADQPSRTRPSSSPAATAG